MKHKTLIDRLVMSGLALVLIVAVSVAYQMGSRSGTSSASEALAAGAAAPAGTGYISVPAAAFVPSHYLVNYTNDGWQMYLNTIYSPDDAFSAPVHLPHGATVTKLTLNYCDNDADYEDKVNVALWACRDGSATNMAYVDSNDDGIGSVSTDSISQAVVDNSQYSYMLKVLITDYGEDLAFHEVLIEFTYPTVFVPLTLRNY